MPRKALKENRFSLLRIRSNKQTNVSNKVLFTQSITNATYSKMFFFQTPNF